MSRKKIYFSILIGALVLVAAAFLANIKPLVVTLGVMKGMANEWQVWAAAIFCAFVFSKYKHYWIVMLVCALVTSLVYQIYLFTPLIKVDFYTICVRSLLFMCIVFGIDYLRLVFKR
ncbi:MAG: hypothetical protein IJ689_00550 [Alphaproteobacteria bacterium]|nr:hypothetical protein [Alphaproteobacteria bacterium]